jgi:hypothetical protein
LKVGSALRLLNEVDAATKYDEALARFLDHVDSDPAVPRAMASVGIAWSNERSSELSHLDRHVIRRVNPKRFTFKLSDESLVEGELIDITSPPGIEPVVGLMNVVGQGVKEITAESVAEHEREAFKIECLAIAQDQLRTPVMSTQGDLGIRMGGPRITGLKIVDK